MAVKKSKEYQLFQKKTKLNNNEKPIKISMIALFALFIAGCSNKQKETTDADKRIENIIGQMTIEEKINMLGG